MARTELPNGVILPAEYSDDWYEDMTSNLTKLDDVIGSDADKLSAEDVGAAALSNDYTDLDNKPALKPVATSGDYDDLDNKPDLKPVATSGDYDDLTDLPTYGITRYCSSAITDNSSVAFSAISSTNKIKVGDFLLDTAGKMYQISAVDTANETVSVTVPLTQLAVDSGVLHKALAEIISGEKTFLDIPIPFKSSTAELGVSGGNTKIFLTDKNLLNLSAIILGNYSSSKLSYCRLCIYDKGSNNQEIERTLEFAFMGTNQNAYFRPSTSDFVSLGTVSNRWKDLYTNKVNGLEPGSLSLPSGNVSDVIDISGYFTYLNGTANTYIAPADGWISITMSNCTGIQAYINGLWGHQIIRPSVGTVRFLMPILNNLTVNILIFGGSIDNARFVPCQGNI